MFKVISPFADLQDNKHLYHVGDIFPHDGRVVSKSRLSELCGSDNKLKKPLIEEIIEKNIAAENKPIEKAETDATDKPVKESVEDKPKKGKKK